MPGVPPLDRCIRVTVGTPEDRALFANAFEKVLARLPA
jgi:histidinol-phosphate/aromatic aminotransferase/cobyric acid decarboxylase-like protein